MRNHKGQFVTSEKSAEGMNEGVRIQYLKEQLAYQQGKLDYIQRNGGRKEKVQYHLDKIAYIEGKLKLFGVEV